MLRLFFALLFLCWSCSPSERKIDNEEYPDFSEESRPAAEQRAITMCGSSAVKRVKYHLVEICQMKFVPAELVIIPGDTVEWINRDITNHDVTEQQTKSWQSPSLSPGKSWKKVLTESAEYYCSIHLVMKGRVRVGAM